MLLSHDKHTHTHTHTHNLVSSHLPVCVCVCVTGNHQQPLDLGAISPHLRRSSRGLSASTPSSDLLLHVSSTLIASHIIWHQRGRDDSRCLPSLAGAHYKNIKISRAERQGELMISLCHRCPARPPKRCQAIWCGANTLGIHVRAAANALLDEDACVHTHHPHIARVPRPVAANDHSISGN